MAYPFVTLTDLDIGSPYMLTNKICQFINPVRGRCNLRQAPVTSPLGLVGRARYVETDKRLHEAIRSCVDSFDHPCEATRRWKIRVPIFDTEGPSLIATITPLLWCFADRVSAPAAMVEISDPRRPHVEEPLELGSCFGLTPAETRVAIALCEGYSIGRYAASAGISILTARTLLKRALAKTHTHSQSELVSLFFRHSIRTGDQ